MCINVSRRHLVHGIVFGLVRNVDAVFFFFLHEACFGPLARSHTEYVWIHS